MRVKFSCVGNRLQLSNYALAGPAGGQRPRLKAEARLVGIGQSDRSALDSKLASSLISPVTTSACFRPYPLFSSPLRSHSVVHVTLIRPGKHHLGISQHIQLGRPSRVGLRAVANSGATTNQLTIIISIAVTSRPERLPRPFAALHQTSHPRRRHLRRCSVPSQQPSHQGHLSGCRKHTPPLRRTARRG